jgi:hypothetical protein
MRKQEEGSEIRVTKTDKASDSEKQIKCSDLCGVGTTARGAGAPGSRRDPAAPAARSRGPTAWAPAGRRVPLVLRAPGSVRHQAKDAADPARSVRRAGGGPLPSWTRSRGGFCRPAHTGHAALFLLARRGGGPHVAACVSCAAAESS